MSFDEKKRNSRYKLKTFKKLVDEPYAFVLGTLLSITKEIFAFSSNA